ncbi:hypothetical protein DFQ30_000939, partial [Apophysomyces sp. BC1015]
HGTECFSTSPCRRIDEFPHATGGNPLTARRFVQPIPGHGRAGRAVRGAYMAAPRLRRTARTSIMATGTRARKRMRRRRRAVRHSDAHVDPHIVPAIGHALPLRERSCPRRGVAAADDRAAAIDADRHRDAIARRMAAATDGQRRAQDGPMVRHLAARRGRATARASAQRHLHAL